jgi:AraC-like DNA-binding protein
MSSMRRHAGEPSLAATRRRIANHVSTNIDDPELSIGAIAAAIGCSRRYLHKAFDAEPETLSEMIWRSRLERCASKLRSAAMADRSITEIAFSSGFNSSPHFSRAFRARYGMAPRDWRKLNDRVPQVHERDAS